MALGLITLNNGENVVSGEGTAFTHDLTSGDFICARAGGILYTLAILSVDGDTEVTLVKAYEGPDETGLAWYAVPRRLQNQITAELVAQNTEALRRANANDANYQRLLTENGYVTITMQNGGEFTGPTWPKIVEIVETADIERLEQLAEQINTDTAQVAADKKETATSAADAKQSAVDGAQYAAAAQQYAAQAGESVTEAGQQVTLANEAANRAQEQAVVSQSSAETATTEADRARSEADRAEEAADRAEAGLPDADVIWEVLGVSADNRQYLQEKAVDPVTYNMSFSIGSMMLAARVSARGSGVYSSHYPGGYLRPAAIFAPYQSAGDSPAVLQIQTNSNASNIPGTWRKLGYSALTALNNADAPIEGESYPVTLWIRAY